MFCYRHTFTFVTIYGLVCSSSKNNETTMIAHGIEFDRTGWSTHGIVKTLPGPLFCLPKTGFMFM